MRWARLMMGGLCSVYDELVNQTHLGLALCDGHTHAAAALTPTTTGCVLAPLALHD